MLGLCNFGYKLNSQIEDDSICFAPHHLTFSGSMGDFKVFFGPFFQLQAFRPVLGISGAVTSLVSLTHKNNRVQGVLDPIPLSLVGPWAILRSFLDLFSNFKLLDQFWAYQGAVTSWVSLTHKNNRVQGVLDPIT